MKIEVSNVRYDHNRRVNCATVLAEVSSSCIVYDNVYVGFGNDKLYIEPCTPNKSANDTKALLQAATFYTVYEGWIIDEIDRQLD